MLSFNLTLILQMVSFLVFAWLFNQVFFKPVVRHIADRDRYLAEQQASAGRLIEEARHCRQEHERRLREAQGQAQAQVDAAVKEAQARRSERLTKARAASQEHIQAARVELGKDHQEALGKLRAEVAGIAAAIGDKLLAAGSRSREGAQA